MQVFARAVTFFAGHDAGQLDHRQTLILILSLKGFSTKLPG